MAIDFKNPSPEAIAVYEAVIDMMRQKDKGITISANKEGGSTLYHKGTHMLYSWEEWGYGKGEEAMDPKRHRTKLLKMLYERATSFESRFHNDEIPLERALLKYLKYYQPESPLLVGKADPGTL